MNNLLFSKSVNASRNRAEKALAFEAGGALKRALPGHVDQTDFSKGEYSVAGALWSVNGEQMRLSLKKSCRKVVYLKLRVFSADIAVRVNLFRRDALVVGMRAVYNPPLDHQGTSFYAR